MLANAPPTVISQLFPGYNVRSAIGCAEQNTKDQLYQHGYSHIPTSKLVIPDHLMAGFEDLKRAAAFLPIDKTCKGAFRYRLYGKLIALPWADSFEPVPGEWDEHEGAYVVEYTQPSSLNPEAEGRRRRFSTFEWQAYGNRFLRELIRFDLSRVPFSPAELAGPIQVGVHLIKLVATEGHEAAASPNLVHRDGEHYTWCHLIERIGCEGGMNWVTDAEWAGRRIEDVPASGVRAGFTVDRPLDSYVVKDDLVAHSVDPIRVSAGADRGTRTVLLIDFTPMQPILMMEAKTLQAG